VSSAIEFLSLQAIHRTARINRHLGLDFVVRRHQRRPGSPCRLRHLGCCL